MSKRAGTLIVLLIMPLCFLVAQPYTSGPNGIFTVDQVSGCAPFTVNLSVPSCDGSIGCDVSYTGNTADFESITLNGNHTYTAPGTYTLRLLRGVEEDNIQIVVHENTLPQAEVVSCGGNRVSVRITDTDYDQYVVNFNDGSPDVTMAPGGTTQHAYGSPGTQNVTIRGRNFSAADNCNPANYSVNTVAAIPTPTVTRLEVLDASSIRLDFNAQPHVLYRLEVAINNGSTFQAIRTIRNVTSDTVTNLLTESNVYCFRLGAYDPCNNVTFYSNVICSATISLAISNNVNTVSFSTIELGSIVSKRVTRLTPSTNQSFSTTVTSSPYLDESGICGTEYCYSVTINYNNNSQSFSLRKCGVSISNDPPDPIENISTVVSDAGVYISWLPDPDFTPDVFSVMKSLGETFVRIDTTSALAYDDPTYRPESGACYALTYRDVCDNQSPQSLTACPIVLHGELSNDNAINLSWTSYGGWSGGVSHYLIDKYSGDGILLETIEPGTALTYTDDTDDPYNQVFIFVVRAVAKVAGQESVSNTIIMIKDPKLIHPSAFTPNGDNLNDIFVFRARYVSQFEIDVFNRWGELVFNSKDIDEGWDGHYKGKEMPEGTYTYVATIRDYAGRIFKRSGLILLLDKKK